MAETYNILKPISNWKGLDLRSSDVERTSEYATDILNAEHRKTGAMNKRNGWKYSHGVAGGCGTFTYLIPDPTTGELIEQLVYIDESGLNIVKAGSISLDYTGTLSCNVDLFLENDGNFFFRIREDNDVNLLVNLGNDSNIAPTVQDLVDAINASTVSISATINDPNIATEAALNFFLVDQLSVNVGTPEELILLYAEPAVTPLLNDVGTVTIDFFEDLIANKNSPAYENPTFANINNVLYIASRYHDLLKYDGNRLIKAGLPTPLDITLNTNNPTGGNLDVESRGSAFYIYVYRYTDAQGNIITSDASLPFEVDITSATDNNVILNIPTVDRSQGFDSENIIIEVYRSVGQEPATFFLVNEVPNIPDVATIPFADATDDSELGFEYIFPIEAHSLPPRMSYIHVYQGLLVGTGDPTNVNAVYYSDIDSPEYFPNNDNSFLIESQIGDRNTGISSLGNSLFVFRRESIHQVLGNLADDSFSVDYYGNARIGCLAHHTIQEVNGFLYFLDSKGVFALDQNGQRLAEVSDVIDPLFTRFDVTFNFQRAVAINDVENDKYLLFMPESNSRTDLSATSNSRVLAFDYVREAWLIWDNINAMGGFTNFNNTIFFSELNTGDSRLAYFKDTGFPSDYADHNTAISFRYSSHWEHLGEPSVFKKFTKVNVLSLDASLEDFESNSFTLDMTTELDWVTGPRSMRTLDFGGQQLGWGDDPWGEFPWGNDRLDRLTTKLRTMKCRSLRVVLENNNLNENVLITLVEYEVATSFKPFIK